MRGQDHDLTVLLPYLRRNLAQRPVIRLIKELESSGELFDGQRRTQQWRPVRPSAPDDPARWDVARFRVPRHRRRVDLVGTTVEINDVPGYP